MERVDFREVFNTKLASIPVLSPERGMEEAWDIKHLGVRAVKKMGVALVFSTNDTDDWGQEIWLADPATLEGFYDGPHSMMMDDLEKFCKTQGLTSSDSFCYKRGEIILDLEDKLYLKVDLSTERDIKNELNHHLWHLQWLSLADRYNLTGIIGAHEELLGESLIGRRRENSYLFNLARQYHLSYFQLMRLRILSLSAKEANLPVSYDRLAKEVAEFN